MTRAFETPAGAPAPAWTAPRALCKTRYRITSVSLPPQEGRNVQQLLGVGLRTQPVPDRAVAYHGRLVERRVVAALPRRAGPHDTHRLLAPRVAELARHERLALHRPRCGSRPAEPGRHDRHPHLVGELRVDHGADHDGRVLGGELFHDLPHLL